MGGGGGAGAGEEQHTPLQLGSFLLSFAFLRSVHLKWIQIKQFAHWTETWELKILLLQAPQVQVGPGFVSMPEISNRSLMTAAGSRPSVVKQIKNNTQRKCLPCLGLDHKKRWQATVRGSNGHFGGGGELKVWEKVYWMLASCEGRVAT